MAGLHFDITGDNSNFMRKLEETQRGIKNTSRLVEQEGGNIESLFNKMAKAAATFAAGLSVKEITQNIVKVRGEFQQLEVAFTTMLGSREKSSELMMQLTETAAKTPFDLQGVANGARQLLAYGTAANDVNETLIRLGNIAAGLSIPLNDLVYLYGTSMTQGRLYTQDLNQFTGRGIPMIKELAKEFGVAESEIKSMVEAGKVGFPEVQKVIQNLTNEGGMFYNLMQEQSKTITGQISNIGDSFSMMLNDVGKSSEGVINNALSGVSYLIENYEEIGKQVLELVSAYGAYKAILITVAAYQKAATGFRYAQEAEELSKLIAIKKTSINQDLEAAMASGKLSQAKAEELVALRAEMQSKIQAAQASKAQADADYANAAASYKAALQRNIVAKQNVALAQSQMQIAAQSGSATEIETARKNAQTAAIELNNAAVAKNTAHKNLAAAASTRKAATESLETLQVGANTAAQVANTKTTNILTIAKTRLVAASKALGVSMLANPYVLATAAVTTLGYGIYKLITYQTEAEKAQERLNDAVKESDKIYASERVQVEELFSRLKSAKEGTDEYRAAKEAIMSRYGEYLKKLGDEKTALNDIARAYELVTETIKNSAREQAMSKYIEDSANVLAEREAEIKEKVRDLLNEKFGDATGEDGISLAETYYWKIVPVLEGKEEMTDEVRDIVKQFDVKTYSGGSLFSAPTVSMANSMSHWIGQAKEAQKVYSDAVSDAKSKYWVAPTQTGDKDNIFSAEGKSISQLEEEIGNAQKQLESLKQSFASGDVTQDAIRQQEAYIKSLQDTVLEREKDLKVISEVEAQISKLRKAQKDTIAGSAEYNSIQKRIDDLSGKLPQTKAKQNEEQKQKADVQRLYNELIELRRKNQQDEINLMEEGSEKKIAQINLDYQKERDAIKKQAEYWAKEQGGTLTIEQFVQINKSYSYAKIKREKGISGVNKEEMDAEIQAMNDYLKEYGTYQEKRLAITQEYSQKINEAGGAGTWSGKTLQKQMEEALADLDIEAAKTTSSISQLFGDMTDKTLTELERINEEGSAALEFLKSGEWDESKGISFGITQEQFNTISKSPEILQAISEALRDNKKSADELRPAYQKIADGLRDIFKAGQDSKQLNEALSDIQDGLNQVMQTTEFLSDTFSNLGDAFGSDTLSGISDGLNVAMDAVNSAIQGAQAGSLFGPIGAAAGAAIGVVSSLASSIAKIHDAKNEKQIQRLQDQIDTLSSTYDKLGREIENAYSKDASNLIEDQNKLLEQQKVLIEQQIAEEKDKKKSDSDRIKEWEEQLEEIDQTIEDNKEKAVDVIFGEDIQSAIENFSSAYAEAWANGGDRAESAKDTVKKMMQEMVTESIKAAVKSSGKMEEIREKLKQFYADNVFSDWEQDYIYKMAEDLQKELDRKFGWADSLFKEEPEEEETAQQQGQATSRGFGSEMTHEDAGELSGRFTAMYEVGLQMLSYIQTIQAIPISIGEQNSILNEIRNLVISSNGYLVDIAGFQKKIYEILHVEIPEIKQQLNNL